MKIITFTVPVIVPNAVESQDNIPRVGLIRYLDHGKERIDSKPSSNLTMIF
jgi:hypothetical protein